MLELLNSIDQSLFLFINKSLANPVTDFLMPILTSDNLLRVLYGAAMVILLWKGDKKLRWMVLFSAVVLLFTDQISSAILKPYFERLRPCHVLENINLLVGCGGGKAMPSSHAANVFGQAVLFSLHYKAARWYLYTFAILVSLSRVFVGVHYPGDILTGAILGAIVGLGISKSMTFLPKQFKQKHLNLFV